ncbi:MAG: site-specific DNA-methyltransferase [Aigarchaeota archaeon]|nr:site-specific DNA-methyltransferase [Aigarchaeota archaeon]MCX8193488.1 site-specific DNA-methyltransferase [Nitrososphaeria archaeon]MDW7986791.1 DNA methyltransferase [Nitrososphaerota archaeon]
MKTHITKKWVIEERWDWSKLVTFIPNKNLPVHSWFYFKEGFSRDFVYSMINLLKLKTNCRVLDPFVGSGTTLLTCKEVGIPSVGIDAAPLAVFVSQVKTADYDIQKLKDTAREVFEKKFEKPNLSQVSKFTKKFFSKPSLEDIIFFREEIRKIEDPVIRNFFTLALMNSAMKVSYAYKDGAVLKVVKKHVPPFRRFFKRVVKKMIRDLKKIDLKPCTVEVYLGDARKMHFLEDESFNAVITSPPYLNKIEYTKVYAIEYELFFGDVKVDPVRSYIGLNPKNIIDQFPELNLPEAAKAYFYDMKLVLEEIYRVLKKKGKAVIVVAGGVFPDRIVESDILLADLAERVGFRVDRIIAVNKRVATVKRVIKIGEARESIIILSKT